MGLRICAYRYIHFRSNRNQLLRPISVDSDMNIRIKSVILICQHFGAGKGGKIEIKFSRKKLRQVVERPGSSCFAGHGGWKETVCFGRRSFLFPGSTAHLLFLRNPMEPIGYHRDRSLTLQASIELIIVSIQLQNKNTMTVCHTNLNMNTMLI